MLTTESQPLLVNAFQYKEWSDRRIVTAARALDDAQHPSSAAFVRQQLNHMVIVEDLFRARLLGMAEPHTATNTATVPSLDELDRRLDESDRWFLQYASRIDPAQLAERLSFDFIDGKRGLLARQEILFHIVNHGTYHRGAIGHALELAGAPRPADTYTVFIHAAEPGRRATA